MRPRQCGIWGYLGIVVAMAGCEPPDDIVPTTPPGAIIPRTPPDADNPAQAQGESAVSTSKPTGEAKKAPAYTPALPTEKGQTLTTKNGVKYETLTPGTGDELKSGQVGLFHYEGKLEDGTIFDSSRERNTPSRFAIGTGQLIRGWEEGLPGMRVGELRKLWIPPAMGYGDRGKGKIPANANLIFEIELVKISE